MSWREGPAPEQHPLVIRGGLPGKSGSVLGWVGLKVEAHFRAVLAIAYNQFGLRTGMDASFNAIQTGYAKSKGGSLD
jgi:hypothetical protein